MKKILFLSTFIFTLIYGCRKEFDSEMNFGLGEIPSQSYQNREMPTDVPNVTKYAPNQIIVKFKTGRPDESFLKAQNSVVKEKILTAAMKEDNYLGIHVLMVPDVSRAVEAFKRNPNVEWVTPNWTVKHQAYTPNDTYYPSSLWGLGNIKAPTAWNTNIGDQQVYIGVIDEGIMYWHEDLCGQIWTNPYETENGIDDDGNGYIDDIHGWDFLHNDKTIYDMVDNHGTHVAGTIGGIGNNGKGVVGVAPNVTMISGKFLEGSGYVSDAIKAVDYMTDLKTRHGMNIAATSNSWGGGGYSQGLYDAINRAKAKDILFVAAAGNNGANTDVTINYPSGYNLDNIISVAAYASDETLPSWTNYGATTVDIGAPGVSILSTLPGTAGSSQYDYYSGTSMATPHVSGAVALYKAGNPNATYTEVRNAILNSSRPIPALQGKCVTGGALNIETFTKATTNQQTTRSCVIPPIDAIPPTAPTNFRVVSMDSVSGTAVLAWNAATDNVGITSYVVSVPYSWYTAGWVLSGNTLTHTPNGLSKGVRYACELYARDAWNNPSPKVSLTFDFFGYDSIPPTTPANFKVVKITPNSVSFSYDWSTDNMSGVGMYRIRYRKVGGYWSGWHTNSVNPLEVPNLATGSQYEFTIAAKDNNHNWSPESSPSIFETPRDVTDNVAPTSPVLSVAGKTLNSVSLSWTSSTDNIGVFGYKVYYKSSASSTWLLASDVGNNRTHTINSLSNNTSYDFYVTAYDGSANASPPSNIVTQKTDNVSYTITTTLTGSISRKTNQNLKWTSTITPSGWRILKTELQQNINGNFQTIYTQTTQSLTGSYINVVNNRFVQSYRVVTTLTTGESKTSNTVSLTSQVR